MKDKKTVKSVSWMSR